MQIPTPGCFYLYHLRCDERYHYIGVTKHLKERIQQHFDGVGATITKHHPPYRIFRCFYLGEMSYWDACEIENQYTLQSIFNYGARVRGGIYTHDYEDTNHILKCNIIPDKYFMDKYEQLPPERYLPKNFNFEQADYQKNLEKKSSLKKYLKTLLPEQAADVLLEYWQQVGGPYGKRNWQDAYSRIIKYRWHII